MDKKQKIQILLILLGTMVAIGALIFFSHSQTNKEDLEEVTLIEKQEFTKEVQKKVLTDLLPETPLNQEQLEKQKELLDQLSALEVTNPIKTPDHLNSEEVHHTQLLDSLK